MADDPAEPIAEGSDVAAEGRTEPVKGSEPADEAPADEEEAAAQLGDFA